MRLTSAFKDRVVVVTGGADGIGAGVCLGFARAGARVVCADIDETKGRELVSSFSGRAAKVRAADVIC